MKQKINISLVSYLNSRPFLYGINKSEIKDQVNITLDTPSECAAKLINGSAQIGLVPVAAISQIRNAKIITDYCIAARGKVKSVILASHVPIEEIKTVLLDNESLTSVRLVKVLAEKYWKIYPEWRDAVTGYENDISGSTAAVVIGDRAMNLRSAFPYVYDLGEEWYKYTKLPFVFACWVTTQNLDKVFLSSFSKALQYGIEHINELVNSFSINGSGDELKVYLKRNIHYHLDKEAKKGMKYFLSMLKQASKT